MHRSVLLIALCLTLVTAIPGFAITWEQHNVDIGFSGHSNVQTADIDGDGDFDIVGADEDHGDIVWWENVPVGDEITWLERSVDDTYDGALTVRPVDLDQDGDMDLIGTSMYPSLDVSWWENVTGDGTLWIWHFVTSAQREDNQRMADAGDIDGDGDMDIVVTAIFSGDAILWMENVDGAGTTWTEHDIVNPAMGPGRVRLGDFDNDGDLDFVTTENAYLYWWENSSGNGSTWVRHTIDDVNLYGHLTVIELTDLDLDGYLDIVMSDYTQDDIFWWKNVSGGQSWQNNAVAADTPFPIAMDLTDIDGDGDIDLTVSSGLMGNLYWVENQDGFGGQWSAWSIDDEAAMSFDHATADFNGDGLCDVVIGGGDDTMDWYEQLASPQPATLTLSPVGSTTIPATGGTLTYDVALASTLPQAVPGVSYWTKVLLPNGTEYGPLFTQRFTLPANADIHVSGLTQEIPAFAPVGQYAFIARVGFAAGPNIQDQFTFDKLATGAMNTPVDAWNHSGTILTAEDSEPTAVTSYSLHDAWPNPFNAATSIQVTLPESAELTVTVFNTMGQQVATLANGSTSAGTHTFSFDASTLASGLYFIHATVPGKLNQVRKVMLVR